MSNPKPTDKEKKMSSENKTDNKIKIYVACLAAYNNGILHGKWIDANQDPFDIWNEVSAMLIASPITDAEEWAIHDYEGFEGYSISEHEGFEDVAKIAAFITEHGTLGGELLNHYNDLEDAQKAIEDHYAGEYKSLSDFAREITEQSGQDIPENLAYYIDYEAMARDMAINDVMTIETSHDQVHVFWSH